MNDIIIVCSKCSCEFVFSVKEQEFFKKKGFTQPKKCKSCKREEKEGGKSGNRK